MRSIWQWRHKVTLLILTATFGYVLAGCQGSPPKPAGYHEGPQKGKGMPGRG